VCRPQEVIKYHLGLWKLEDRYSLKREHETGSKFVQIECLTLKKYLSEDSNGRRSQREKLSLEKGQLLYLIDVDQESSPPYLLKALKNILHNRLVT